MSIKYSTDPGKRQGAYTEQQALTDSLQRAGSLVFPLAGILTIPTFFLIFCLASWIRNLSQGNQILIITICVLAILMPIIISGIILRHVFKSAKTFLKIFYALPDSVDIAQLVNLRVFGRPPLPFPLASMIKFPTIKVANRKLEPPGNWLTKIGGPTKLKIESGNAIYVERGNRFSRIIGQGDGFLELHEVIKTSLYIGPQYEDISFTAWTRDGISVGVKAKGEFILGRQERIKGKENELYPFYPDAIRKAVDEAFSNSREGHEWAKSARGKTIGYLGEYISSKYLNEIFISKDGGQLLSTNTMNDFVSKINIKLEKSGTCLTNLQITNLDVHERILQQRIKLWEIGHKTHATVSESEIKAYQIRSQKEVLAEIIRDFVFSLANGLERMEKNDLTKELLKSIYEVINQGMKNPLAYLKSTSKIMPDGVETPELEFNFEDGKE